MQHRVPPLNMHDAVSRISAESGERSVWAQGLFLEKYNVKNLTCDVCEEKT